MRVVWRAVRGLRSLYRDGSGQSGTLPAVPTIENSHGSPIGPPYTVNVPTATVKLLPDARNTPGVDSGLAVVLTVRSLGPHFHRVQRKSASNRRVAARPGRPERPYLDGAILENAIFVALPRSLPLAVGRDQRWPLQITRHAADLYAADAFTHSRAHFAQRATISP